MTKSLIAALAGAALVVLPQSAVLAQSSPPPVGIWKSPTGETFIIGQTCQISANGVVGAMGNCSWNGSANGGILTIVNVNAYQPAPVYFNILWVNKDQISVYGDPFYRQQ